MRFEGTSVIGLELLSHPALIAHPSAANLHPSTTLPSYSITLPIYLSTRIITRPSLFFDLTIGKRVKISKNFRFTGKNKPKILT